MSRWCILMVSDLVLMRRRKKPSSSMTLNSICAISPYKAPECCSTSSPDLWACLPCLRFTMLSHHHDEPKQGVTSGYFLQKAFLVTIGRAHLLSSPYPCASLILLININHCVAHFFLRIGRPRKGVRLLSKRCGTGR